MTETAKPTLADELRGIDMGYLWLFAAIVAAVFGYGVTRWDTIKELIDQKESALAFLAGYTLPLTVGFGILSFRPVHVRTQVLM